MNPPSQGTVAFPECHRSGWCRLPQLLHRDLQISHDAGLSLPDPIETAPAIRSNIRVGKAGGLVGNDRISFEFVPG